ncbi:myotrophin [Brachionus plicatilis]|uniref:Myotrophin n=1 Tax=Brachionus plicatilis TaxID=10195 RepID=A0A3M7R9K6_BRAPC|nr:myotrophin [Brachionus plicatilis]
MIDYNSEAFIWSIKNGDLETISKYIDSNPKVINILIKGRTFLHYACDYGQKEIIEYLLNRGANINVQDKYNISPLLAAIWENHVSCVKLLLNKGANRSVKAPDGRSLIESTDNDEIKRLLKF